MKKKQPSLDGAKHRDKQFLLAIALLVPVTASAGPMKGTHKLIADEVMADTCSRVGLGTMKDLILQGEGTWKVDKFDRVKPPFPTKGMTVIVVDNEQSGGLTYMLKVDIREQGFQTIMVSWDLGGVMPTGNVFVSMEDPEDERNCSTTILFSQKRGR